MRRVHIVLAVAVAAAALGLAATTDAATKPVSGSIAGPVTSVKGDTFAVKTTLSPTGSAKVSIGSKTVITKQVAARSSAVKKGVCVMAVGTKSSKGAVAAARVTITTAVNGACTSAGRRPGAGGNPSAGAQPPNVANYGVAFGQVVSVKGTTVTVKGTSGSTRVTLSKKTQFTETERVGRSAIAAKSCAFVRGTSADKGKTVAATNVSLTTPTKSECTFGPRGR